VELRVLEGIYALCRLPGDAPLPAWFALDPPFAAAIRRGPGELSLVLEQGRVPDSADAERGYRALEVAGPLDLAMTGVMSVLSAALAGAGVPILPLATHDTDVILVPGGRLEDASAALREAGHTVVG
jgi:hypothetical protein